MNSTLIGNVFRDYVLRLLQSKFPDAHSEGKAAWKNADIMFSMMELGKRIQVAVECKNYTRSLKTKDFTEIVGQYHAALESGDINLLLVVSNKPVEAASRKLINSIKNLRFLTIGELESWLVGLEPYVQSLVEEFNADEVHQYYIEGRFEGIEGNAFNYVQSWIDSDDATDNGLAVLGGYGLGKSSLAKRVASAQARRYLLNPESERLPILLPLGQVVHETELAALFGKQFTSRYSLETYSYKTLLQLNKAGRLLVILDGFDEMKHAMTEHDFRSNFREFNKLRVLGAKVLLLGRPNAFTSESSNLLIRGLAELDGQAYLNSDFPAWKECRLAFFTSSEQRQFLDGFLKYKNVGLADDEARRRRIDEVVEDIDDEILQRPVQARIVGLLAADLNYTFRGTNRFRLYADFVRQVIQRDQEKRARSLIPAEHRHRFLKELAWWSWTRAGVSQGTFRREEVPDALFHGLSDGHAVDHQAKRAEYLVSSLTEEKDASFLYFAHRSFHEFLVAAHITALPTITQADISDISSALNEELIEFLRESRDELYLDRIYDGLSSIRTATVSARLLSLLGASSIIPKIIFEKPIDKLSWFDVLIVCQNHARPDSLEDLIPWLGSILRDGSPAAADAAGFSLVDQFVRSGGSQELFVVEFLARAWERMLSGEPTSEDMLFDVRDKESLEVSDEKLANIGDVLREWTRKLRLNSGDFILLNSKQAYAVLYRALTSYGFVSPERTSKLYIPEIDQNLVLTRMAETPAKKFKEFYQKWGDDFRIYRQEFQRERKVPKKRSKK
ncbi:MAG: DUF2034 domain-containing protein [Pseudomonadota bacterium]